MPFEDDICKLAELKQQNHKRRHYVAAHRRIITVLRKLIFAVILYDFAFAYQIRFEWDHPSEVMTSSIFQDGGHRVGIYFRLWFY